jgi:NADP-dependent 3-hydroxy acid dehydrogenase YdfG
MARQLVRRGDAVAAAARRSELLAALARDTASDPGRLSIHTLDVTDAAAVGRVMRAADDALGGLEVVVVNAGRAGGARLGRGRFHDNRAVVETNLIGALAQIETALDLFRRREGGHLVLVSSLAGDRGLPGAAAVYSATKAALSSIGESLHIELAGSGIAVTTLRPGFIRTPLNEGSRFPFLSPIETGVAAMIEAMDGRRGQAVVPAWPWRPLAPVLRVLPEGLLRRFL